MNTSTDLGCEECGQPWPIYTNNCNGCEARAMACFEQPKPAEDPDHIEPWNPWALACGLVIVIILWGLGWLALGLGIGLAVEFVRSL